LGAGEVMATRKPKPLKVGDRVQLIFTGPDDYPDLPRTVGVITNVTASFCVLEWEHEEKSCPIYEEPGHEGKFWKRVKPTPEERGRILTTIKPLTDEDKTPRR
jgi:hypothetical protein